MAGILGFLAVLSDDISSIASKSAASMASSISGSLGNSAVLLDDIVTYTKVASAKSAGVVVDDLAAIASISNETTTSMFHNEVQKAHSLNELKENISKFTGDAKIEMQKELLIMHERVVVAAQRNAAARELPIVWKIALGSARNKLIIIPLILIISSIAPWLMMPILLAGGIFLTYEGAESVLHKLFSHKKETNGDDTIATLNMERFESHRVSSAIKTDFILSLEIMVLSLSLIGSLNLMGKIGVLLAIGLIATLGVYGIVALIIKLDDIGYFLQARRNRTINKLGDNLVAIVSPLLQTISVIGTVAMLGVGGGIIAHQLHLLGGMEAWIEDIIPRFVWFGGFVANVTIGLGVGIVVVKLMPIVTLIRIKIKKLI